MKCINWSIRVYTWVYVCLCADARYSMDSRGLTIRNITQADNGEYKCRAEVKSEGRYDERLITVAVHSQLFPSLYVTIHSPLGLKKLLCFRLQSGKKVRTGDNSTARNRSSRCIFYCGFFSFILSRDLRAPSVDIPSNFATWSTVCSIL